MSTVEDTARRVRARVEGAVQGVGFRPYVYRLAGELELAGWVLNDERGVLLEVEGPAVAVEQFLARLEPDAPPLAVVERVTPEDLAPTGETGFAIVESEHGGEPDAPVSPDAATCEDCLRELFDPADRRHRYPFVNCTNCGPRFTIVRGVPYDRPLDHDGRLRDVPGLPGRVRRSRRPPLPRPAQRLPGLRPVAAAGDRARPRARRARSARRPWSRRSRTGLVVAVKGIGGYHLACRADEEQAVAALRARKRREDRPFALMAPDLDAARALVELTPAEEELLAGRERPIVIARRRPGAAGGGSGGARDRPTWA